MTDEQIKQRIADIDAKALSLQKACSELARDMKSAPTDELDDCEWLRRQAIQSHLINVEIYLYNSVRWHLALLANTPKPNIPG